MKTTFVTLVLIGGVLLSGCRTSNPVITSTDSEIPSGWVTPVSGEELLAAEQLAVWWTLFEDEQLTRLVQAALDENLDLKNAAARVEEAFALRAVAAGEKVPAVNASAGIFETDQSALAGGASFTGYSVGFDASWELDLWGRIRKSVDAADAAAQASVEDLRGVRALVASQVVASYVSLRELQLRQALALENIARQQNTLKLTLGRFENGLSPRLDVNQAQVNLSSTEAVLPRLRQQEFQALRALELLSGMTPGELNGLLEEARPVPTVQPDQLTDLPANVLRRRPDLRAAEQRLIAAALRVGVAEADLYPRISLSGSFAWEAGDAGSLFEGDSVSTRFGPSLRLPIFQGGRLRAQVEVREAQALQAELGYRQQMLTALQEVENALTSYQQEQERLQKLQEGVAAAEATVVQVRSLYENGLVTFLNVLDAERNLAAQQDAAAASLGQSSRNLVDVYRAFGGGWDAPE
ncbi:MAG: efflux transporter outer membrane subunit, partial [Kiritimatiellia bacterium]